MKRLIKYYRLPENTEILFMLTLGIVLQVTDGSPFAIKKRCQIVWDTELPPENFSQFVQHCIKMILSGIVIARCLTTYVYAVSAMLVMYSITKNTCPRLMLPWLLISAVKSIFLTFVEALTGVYVCSSFGKIRKACVEFFLSKALEIIFAAYLWANVLNIHREMELKRLQDKKPKNWEEFYKQIDFKRPRTRSLLDESILHKTARLNSFEFKDVPQIILQMLRREEEMSQDSLLGSGMMLASVSNFGSFDDLKTSQSLGELGLLDMKTVLVKGIEDDEYLSPQEKALRFLKLNWDDVKKAQESKRANEKSNFAADSDIWNRFAASQGNLKKPKQARPEIVLKKISRLKFDDEKNGLLDQTESIKKKSFELKFGFSLFSFLREKDELRRRDEEQLSTTYNLDEEEEEAEEDGGSTLLFMSNIREEIAVNRIRFNFVSRKLKGNAYSKLYKEDYMSHIGPEVFDTATRLPKVLPPMNFKMGARHSASLPAFVEAASRSKKKINFDGEFADRADGMRFVSSWNFPAGKKRGSDPDPASSDCYDSSSRQEPSYILAEEDLENATVEVESMETDENCDSTKMVKTDDSQAGKTDDIEGTGEECSEERKESDGEISKNGPCFRKRRIAIKIRGKRLAKSPGSNSGQIQNSSDGGKDGDDVLDESFHDFGRNPMDFDDEKPSGENPNKNSTKDDPSALNGITETKKVPNRKQVYLLMKLFQRPFIGGRQAGAFGSETANRRRQTLKDLLELDEPAPRNYFASPGNPDTEAISDDSGRKKKIWKSKVLETAATYNPEIENSSNPKSDYLSNVVMVVLKKKLINGGNDSSSDDDKNECDDGNGREIETNSFEADRFVIYDRRKFDDFKTSTRNRNFFVGGNLKSDYFRDDFPSVSNRNYANDADSAFSIREIDGSEPSESEIIGRWMDSAFFDDGLVEKGRKTNCKNRESRTEMSEDEDGSPEGILENSEPLEAREKFSETENSNGACERQSRERESEESFSLYYSKAADLASPLLDMKRFIYPDHIHYSYKHVKKKGFDVDIDGKLPLLFRESLTMNNPIGVKNVSGSENPESRIVRRPMDLSFADKSDFAFADWQNTDTVESATETADAEDDFRPCRGSNGSRSTIDPDGKIGKRGKRSKRKNRRESLPRKCVANRETSKSKSLARNLDDVMQIYSAKDYFLMEKFLGVRGRSNASKETSKTEAEAKRKRLPVQISSAQLHSNKGRVNPIRNPAVFLNENKTRKENKKSETREERTKDMFARLEREALLQTKKTAEKLN